MTNPNRYKLVLLPGLDGTGVLFRPLLQALPLHIEPLVIAYPTQEPLGYGQLLDRVRAALPSDSRYVLLGESFGGPLALRLAAAQPSGLCGVILAGSFVHCPIRGVPAWAAHAVPAWPFRAMPILARLKHLMQMNNNIEHLNLSLEALRQVAPQVFAERIREIVRIDVAAELDRCTLPLLYLQGEFDGVVGAHNLRRIRAIKPSVQAIAISSGHMILKTQPQAAARAIGDFLQALP